MPDGPDFLSSFASSYYRVIVATSCILVQLVARGCYNKLQLIASAAATVIVTVITTAQVQPPPRQIGGPSNIR